MKRLLLILLLIPFPAAAQDAGGNDRFIRSVTLEGGPVATEHFQAPDDEFREHHGLGILKVATEDYGTWGLYVLSPNSVDDTSIGAGYVTEPYVVPLGPTELELTGALGLVTGYQDYPVPLLAAEARLTLYESGPWNAGLAMAANPYFMEDETGDNVWGIVATTPFLSVRYSFN